MASKLVKLLEKAKASELDRVAVSTSDGMKLEGLVMPRIEYGDTDCLILKLDSGYNAGISADKIEQMKVISKASPKAVAKKSSKAGGSGNALPQVVMIATGGTIASIIDYSTGGVTGKLEAEQIAEAIPGLQERISISAFHSPFRIMSEDMTHKEWQKLAQISEKELKREEVRGIILTHGTDTLHFTSAAMAFMLNQFKKPVAIVGAQRSTDRGSFDGIMNMQCAATYATGDIGETAVVMHGSSNDDYAFASRGTKVRKMHASRRDAFQPINDWPLAKIWPDGRMEKTNQMARKTEETPDAKAQVAFEPKVAILKTYPASDPGIIEYYAKKGFRGLIIEGTGLGHVPTAWVPAIKEAVDDGILVGITTQCINGKANPYVYSNLRKLAATGAQYLSDMLTETAYVKLGWALGQKKSAKDVSGLMATNVAGEYNNRHEYYKLF